MKILFISPLPVLFPHHPVNLIPFLHISVQPLRSGHLWQQFDVDRYVWVQFRVLYDTFFVSRDSCHVAAHCFSFSFFSYHSRLLVIYRALSTKGLIEYSSPRVFKQSLTTSIRTVPVFLSFCVCSRLRTISLFILILLNQSARRRLAPIRAAEPPCVILSCFYADIPPLHSDLISVPLRVASALRGLPSRATSFANFYSPSPNAPHPAFHSSIKPDCLRISMAFSNNSFAPFSLDCFWRRIPSP